MARRIHLSAPLCLTCEGNDASGVMACASCFRAIQKRTNTVLNRRFPVAIVLPANPLPYLLKALNGGCYVRYW